jgi:transposase
VKVLALPANITDREGGEQLLKNVREYAPRLQHLWIDGGYKGKWVRRVEQVLGISVEVVQHAYAGISGLCVHEEKELTKEQLSMLRGHRTFKVLPRRWVVERTYAWLSFQRHLVKDYELLPETSEAFIHTAMIRIMVGRLASSTSPPQLCCVRESFTTVSQPSGNPETGSQRLETRGFFSSAPPPHASLAPCHRVPSPS